MPKTDSVKRHIFKENTVLVIFLDPTKDMFSLACLVEVWENFYSSGISFLVTLKSQHTGRLFLFLRAKLGKQWELQVWRHHALCTNMDFPLFQTFLTHSSDTLVVYHAHTSYVWHTTTYFLGSLVGWQLFGSWSSSWHLTQSSSLVSWHLLYKLEYWDFWEMLVAWMEATECCTPATPFITSPACSCISTLRDHQPFSHVRRQVRVLRSSSGSHCGYKMELGCESNVQPQCLGFSCAGFELFRFWGVMERTLIL